MNKMGTMVAAIFLNMIFAAGALAFIDLPPGSLPEPVRGLPTRVLTFDGSKTKWPVVLEVTVTDLSLIGADERIKIPGIGVIHPGRARAKVVMTLANVSPSGRRATVRIFDVWGCGPAADHGRYYPVDKIVAGVDGKLSRNHPIVLTPGRPTQVLLSAAIDHQGKLKPGEGGMIFVPMLGVLRQLKTLALPRVSLFHLSRIAIP